MIRRLRDLTALANRYRFSIVGTTGGGHVRLQHTSGAVYVTSSTPRNEWRRRRNIESDLRRIDRSHGGA